MKNEAPPLKDLCTLICSELKCRGSSWESVWVIHEGEILTNFRACVGGRYLLEISLGMEALVGIISLLALFYSTSTQLTWCWCVPALTLSINLIIICFALTFHSGLAQLNIPIQVSMHLGLSKAAPHPSAPGRWPQASLELLLINTSMVTPNE